MRRTKKHFLTTALHSRAYKCRVERLEVRSMLAADGAEVVDDAMSNEGFETFDPTAVEVQPAEQIGPTIIDDSCLMVVNPITTDPITTDPITTDPITTDPITTDPITVDPIDVRVQFVSSDAGWAAFYYTIGSDGSVLNVSVVASYDDPTISAFIAEHADDDGVQISDFGDGWFISNFPIELAPPVPDAGVFATAFEVCPGVSGGEDDTGVAEIVDGGIEWSSDDTPMAVVDAYIGEMFVATSSYARAGELPGPIDNVALTGAPVPREAPVATPAALDPRAAAFADMRMLSAAALTTHGDASESGVPGGGRRRR